MTDTLTRPETMFARWIATVHYRTEAGLVDVQHDLDEIEDLQDLVEHGPHFGAIDHINIVYALGGDEKLTVEGAREIGRASCRERVGQYVLISVVAVELKKKNN